MRWVPFSLIAISLLLAACSGVLSAEVTEPATIMVTQTIHPIETPTLTQTSTPTLEPTFTPTSASTLEPTSTPPPTPTPIQCYLEVLVFHDRNGNEVQGVGEPPVSGTQVQIGDKSCVTGADGKCELGPVWPGVYHLEVDTSGSNIEALNYLFADREVLSPRDGLPIQVEGDALVTVALGQGPFPIPIAAESFRGVLYGFGDLHYMNGRQVPHAGLDIAIRGDGPQPIFAPIPGQARPGPDGTWGDCNHVTIWYNQLGFNVGVGMGHLTEVIVEPNAFVRKGEIIGYIDPTLYHSQGMIACTSDPHIHMNIWGNIPGETWPHEDSGLPWQVLPAGEWGWLNPEKYLPMIGNPIPMFDSVDEAEAYAQH